MSTFFDVRVRVPKRKLGDFVDELPEWAQVMGFDALGSREEEDDEEKPTRGKRATRANGKYVPGEGTHAETAFKIIKSRQRPVTIHELVEMTNAPKSGIASGVTHLLKHGLVRKTKDGYTKV